MATGPRGDAAGFRPLRELYEAPEVLRQHAREIGALLRIDEIRVAVSILHLGIAARLWSVALGTAVLGGTVPRLDIDRTHWRREIPGPMELWDVTPDFGPHSGTADDAELVATLRDTLVEVHLLPLTRAARTVSPLAEQLFWGNAASALVGAANALDRHLRPVAADQAERAVRLARNLQAHGRLHGTGTWPGTDGGPAGGEFRRTTCCLYYRTPEGGTCGDCVFGDHPPRPRATTVAAADKEPSA